MDRQQAEVLEGTVEDIVFHNEDTGFTVMEVAAGEALITVVGEAMGIRIRYDGRAYDPFDHREFHGEEDLGIQLITGMMKQVVYQRTFGVNTVQLLL